MARSRLPDGWANDCHRVRRARPRSVFHSLREQVERASHAAPAAVEDVRVDHGGLDAPVAEELLDGPDVVSILEQMGRERVAKGVAGDSFRQPDRPRGPSDGALHGRGMKVEATP